MSLRLKSILIVVTVMALLTVVLWSAAGYVFERSYQKLEQRELQESYHRVKGLLADNREMLSSQVGDWGAWDESYDFVETGNPAFIQRNIPPSTFKDIKVNLIMFVNTSGRIVYEGWYDWKTAQVTGSKISLHNHLAPGSRLLSHSFPSDSVSGIINLAEGPLLLAARPILPSSRTGTIRGTIIMGRFLDDVEIERLSKASRVSFAVGRMGDPYLSPEFSAVLTAVSSSKQSLVKPFGERELAIYGLMDDLYGKPALVLRTKIPAEVSREGVRAERAYTLILWLAMGCGILLLGVALHRVLAPLSALGSAAGRAWNGTDPGEEVPSDGGGEIATISRTINGLLKVVRGCRTSAAGADPARFRRFFERVPVGCYVAGPDGKMLECNAVLADALGFDSADEAVAAGLLVCPDEAQRDALLKKLAKQKTLQQQKVELSCRFGKLLPTVQNIVALLDTSGEVQQIEGCILSHDEPMATLPDDPPAGEPAVAVASEEAVPAAADTHGDEAGSAVQPDASPPAGDNGDQDETPPT
ncbi:MAG: hypothetical protein HZC44_07435 [Geobacter sp.]|nr:hypothetical protein [Geobacter sp.]